MRLKVISLVIGILSGLSACSTTEKATNVTVTEDNQQQRIPDVLNASGLFNKAISKQGIHKIQLLYSAREAAIIEQDWQTLEQACLALESKNSVDHVQNKLYIALARKEMANYTDALSILRTLSEQLKLPEHQGWHQYLMGSIYASQQLPKKALVHYFKASDIAYQNNLTFASLNDETWRALQQLSSYALERFDTGSVVQQGWTKLAKYQQIYLGTGVELHQAMNNWQRRFINHPASYILPKEVTQAVLLSPYETKKLAILLPQSGPSERLGAALKNGFLAASDNWPDSEIFFIDEMQTNIEIEAQLAQNQADFVIGPLLKNNIEKLSDSSTLHVLPTIHLNTKSSQSQQNPNHYYFALNPEHEVEQALVHFLAKKYQKPMLLAPDSSSGKRLVEHFSEQWRLYSEAAPEVGLYTDSKNMAKVIANLLEVENSKQRIKTIESLYRKTDIESETRSRRDIDVIYILGNASETRLLKPYLDVNVSTFAPKIPLYASSRSYSRRIDTTDKSDLEGLYFTEQPWMLPNTTDNRALRNQYMQLWPEQADIEQRLFAMAFDAVALIGEIKQLAKIPGKEFIGLTGQLSIKSDNTIHRRLKWAQYYKQQIRTINLNEQAPLPLFMQSAAAENRILKK
ncbi:penicillin-binding protein activator [Pseudoalteromonas sp. MMG012]|uniref:penicillin-binding protein activator n=1 Tax=Pseudoalteromonas sp. MMG012 TaxID=2822686 RepID=UPI001B3A3484|nr:penicillin-binding protein activator [Pseudoalteromonas sp. MMG012]MBQ4849582.1 penicillin-binding protein activator [Pseudoalteromonas sp. MMG012]